MLSQRLKELRKKSGYTQAQLGKLLNLSRTTISYYESGKLEPSIDTIIKISEIFNTSTDYLLKN